MAGITVDLRTDELEASRIRLHHLIDHIETEDNNLRPEEARVQVRLIILDLEQWIHHLNAVAND